MSASDTYKRVVATRRYLLLDGNEFFGTRAMKLKLVEDPTCATMWTDGATIGFNPTFVEQQTRDELVGVFVHEIGHVILLHPYRRDGRDPDGWNVACDYALNAMLLKAGFKLPVGGLYKPEYEGRSPEWIYARLPKGNGNDPNGAADGEGKGEGTADDGEPDTDATDGNGNATPDSSDSGEEMPQPQPGEVRDAPNPADEPDAPTMADAEQATREAALASSAAGTNKGNGAAEMIKSNRDASVDWRSLLERFASETAYNDYTMTRPNPRYMPHVYLPSLHSKECGRFVFAVDTSGSIDKVALTQFVSELNAIVDIVKPASVTVIYCDRTIDDEPGTFARGEHIDVKVPYGGGTDLRPPFEYVNEEMDETPAAFIYFTDLCGPTPELEPDYPVLWACTRPGMEQPFGELVELNT
jgi:predicted metal-dependent peptidase